MNFIQYTVNINFWLLLYTKANFYAGDLTCNAYRFPTWLSVEAVMNK